MSQGLDNFKCEELKLVIDRRYNNPIKGLGYWAAYDAIHRSDEVDSNKVKVTKITKVGS